MFIFDTDIYTNVLRKNPSEKLLNRLKKVPRRDQFTTTITIAEAYYGLMKASNMTRLLKLFETVLLPRATILPFDFSAAKKYGEIRISNFIIKVSHAITLLFFCKTPVKTFCP